MGIHEIPGLKSLGAVKTLSHNRGTCFRGRGNAAAQDGISDFLREFS